jgi:2-amino-4-hydroxy-6-hydroxymethyldihydropteridine diphosphokinase
MIQVAFSFGSNLGNGEENILKSLKLLEENDIDILAVSSFYKTNPEGFLSENFFTNAVAIAETNLSPNDLIELVLKIELEMGRKRNSDNYEDRIIDLDVLLYGKEVINNDMAIIPHPRMHLRRFVLEPLSEIAPNWEHPVLKSKIIDVLKHLN